MNDLMKQALQAEPDAEGSGALQGTDCPSPEVWHEFASGLLGEARTVSRGSGWTADRLESHAAACAVCSAELEMARAFVDEARTAGAGPDPVPRHEAATVVSLDSARTQRAAGHVEPGGEPRRATASTWLAAAAVLLALIAGYATWVSRPPSIQGPGSGAVLRGDSLTLLEPQGEIDGLPSVFDWEAEDGVGSYMVEVRRLDGRVVFRREVAAPPLRLTTEEQSSLMPRVRYEWEVRALARPAVTGAEREVLQGASSNFTVLANGADSAGDAVPLSDP